MMPVLQSITVALPIALDLVMIATRGANFAGPSLARHNFALWGYPAGFHRVAGSLGVVIGLRLLIPLTSVVGRSRARFSCSPRRVTLAGVEVDYRQRLEPDAILDALKAPRAA